MSVRKAIELILVGHTGTGKSAVGNSILGKEVFESSSSAVSETSDISSGTVDFDGTKIKVVDSPGVGDTRYKGRDRVEFITQVLTKAIKENPEGYHAFLFVVRFGGRFTDENVYVINFLKQMFSADIMKKFGILIMTHGDNFQKESRKKGLSFKDWCSRQTGELKTLIKECSGRVLLFDNDSEDETVRHDQLKELLKAIRSLPTHGQRYTDKHFQEAAKSRDKLMVESKKGEIQRNVSKKLDLIMEEQGREACKGGAGQSSEKLSKLLIRCEELLKYVRDEDKATGVLHYLETNISHVQRAVEIAIQNQNGLRALDEQRKVDNMFRALNLAATIGLNLAGLYFNNRKN